MKKHSDKGRYIIAQAIINSKKTSYNLKNTALDCILAYQEKSIMKISNEIICKVFAGPEEKAYKLFSKYYIICMEYTEEIQCSIQAKECAIICCDEVLSNIQDSYNLLVPTNDLIGQNNLKQDYEFWQKIKSILESK